MLAPFSNESPDLATRYSRVGLNVRGLLDPMFGVTITDISLDSPPRASGTPALGTTVQSDPHSTTGLIIRPPGLPEMTRVRKRNFNGQASWFVGLSEYA